MPTTSVTPDKDSLKKLRVSRGLSQKQAGEQCGVGNWGRYEQGKPMSLRVLRRITEFFGIPGATIAPGLPIAEAARRTQRPQDRILEAPGTYGPRNGADALAGPHAALGGDDHLRHRIERLTRMVSELAVENSDLKAEVQRLKGESIRR